MNFVCIRDLGRRKDARDVQKVSHCFSLDVLTVCEHIAVYLFVFRWFAFLIRVLRTHTHTNMLRTYFISYIMHLSYLPGTRHRLRHTERKSSVDAEFRNKYVWKIRIKILNIYILFTHILCVAFSVMHFAYVIVAVAVAPDLGECATHKFHILISSDGNWIE